MNNDKITIGNIIKYIRKESNYTQKELASIVNIGRSTLSDYEREKTDINFYTITDICNACGFEIEFINNKTKDIITISNIDRKI